MKSIRAYLLTRLLGGAALVLVAAGALVYLTVSRSFERQFDASLVDRAQSFVSMFFQVADEVEFEFSGELMPEFELEENPSYFQLWFATGELLERSDSLGESDLVVPVPIGPDPSTWIAPLPDGRPGRYVSQRLEIHHVYPEEGPDRPIAKHIDVVLARGTENLRAATVELMATCAFVALALLALLGALAWRSVRRGLDPARRLARALDAIRVEQLPPALDVGELPHELRPVVQTTDALLGRIQVAMARERRTTADIAHELRTPISEVLTVSEVALRGDHALNGSREALETVRDVAGRMARSISTLLKLTRLEMGSERFAQDAIELAPLVAELRRSLTALERDRGLEVHVDVGAKTEVRGDGQVVRIVLSNLLANAFYYAPRGSSVVVRARSGADAWTVSVTNGAPDLEERDLEALTEPFWRKDRARADRNRSGLGLALSCALAEAAGLTLEFELAGGLFTARIEGRGDRALADRA